MRTGCEVSALGKRCSLAVSVCSAWPVGFSVMTRLDFFFFFYPHVGKGSRAEAGEARANTQRAAFIYNPSTVGQPGTTTERERKCTERRAFIETQPLTNYNLRQTNHMGNLNRALETSHCFIASSQSMYKNKTNPIPVCVTAQCTLRLSG